MGKRCMTDPDLSRAKFLIHSYVSFLFPAGDRHSRNGKPAATFSGTTMTGRLTSSQTIADWRLYGESSPSYRASSKV